MKQTIAILSAAGVFLMSGLYMSSVGAQAPAPAPAAAPATTQSVTQGVYTADQAARGKMLYTDNCAACHGDDLAGSGPMPPLAGADFIAAWKDKTVGDLFEKTHSSMPASAPGTLTEQQTADILAYVLSIGKYPAGTTELAPKMEPLMTIKIEPPPQ
jgi:mono/diheme cytochrome c family protein